MLKILYNPKPACDLHFKFSLLKFKNKTWWSWLSIEDFYLAFDGFVTQLEMELYEPDCYWDDSIVLFTCYIDTKEGKRKVWLKEYAWYHHDSILEFRDLVAREYSKKKYDCAKVELYISFRNPV